MNERKCYRCGEAHDQRRDNLRPYGPNGKDVCFPCATSTPEDEAVARRYMKRAMDAIDGPAVLTQNGPKSVADAIADELLPKRKQ